MKKRQVYSTLLLCAVIALGSCSSGESAAEAAPSVEGGATDGAFGFAGDYSADSSDSAAADYSEDFSYSEEFERLKQVMNSMILKQKCPRATSI